MKILLLFVFALAAFGAPRLYRKILRPRYLRRRYRRILNEETSYEIGEFLGMGRDGVVFGLESGPGEPINGGRLAIKVHYASAKGATARRSELYQRMIEDAAQGGALAEAGLLRIYETGECATGSRHVAFEVIERVEGETLKALRRKNYFGDAGREASIALVQQLLDRLQRLEALGIFFVHVDLDNLILDPAGNLRIIDIESLTLGQINKKYRRRYYRRISQTISEILNQAGIRPDAYGQNETTRSFFDKLDAHMRSAKNAPPSSESSFASLDEIRAGIASLLQAPANHTS